MVMKQAPTQAGVGAAAGKGDAHSTEPRSIYASVPSPGPQEETGRPLELGPGSLPGMSSGKSRSNPFDFHSHLCLCITAALFLGTND